MWSRLLHRPTGLYVSLNDLVRLRNLPIFSGLFVAFYTLALLEALLPPWVCTTHLKMVRFQTPHHTAAEGYCWQRPTPLSLLFASCVKSFVSR